jgi:protein-L-isoaspartate O-methyltransferase
MNLKTMLLNCRRRLRWIFGYGWSVHEFQNRYAEHRLDAWGYTKNQLHLERLARILTKIPAEISGTVLEVGCAEGFVTRQLSSRATQVVACDLSEVAVQRAQQYCDGLSNVRFHCVDIRHQIPANDINVCLMSDVIYYLSTREIREFATKLPSQICDNGLLIIANEWNTDYRDLTHPEKAVQCIDGTGYWRRVSLEHYAHGDEGSHWIAVFEVVKQCTE